MYIINKNNVLVVVWLLVLVALLSACSSMQVVSKQLEEGRLVPAEAVKTSDFLNQYEHPLPAPTNKLLQIDIALEKDQLMSSGDSLDVQVGLVTKKPVLQSKNYHLLLFNPASVSNQQQHSMNKAVEQFKAYINQLPVGSRLSIDWMDATKRPSDVVPSLIKSNGAAGLEDFLRRYARLKLQHNKDHFILVLANQGNLWHDEKQNLIDLANIFRIKGASLSVLSVADKPEVGFLNKMSSKGDGLFNLVNKTFNYKKWTRDQVDYINANRIQDIRLSIRAVNGSSIRQVLSPADMNNTGEFIKHNIKQLRQGDNYVLMANLDVPALNKSINRKIMEVEVEYFDRQRKKYVKNRKTAKVNFVSNRNQTIGNENKYVKRSKLILGTQAVISDIVPVIREKRYYQAVAILTEHAVKLEAFADKYNDKELKRDAGIINAYANNLYEYNDKSFEAFKIWLDLSWDADRFSESYR